MGFLQEKTLNYLFIIQYGMVRELGYVGVDETQDIDEFVRMSSRSGFSMANQEV